MDLVTRHNPWWGCNRAVLIAAAYKQGQRDEYKANGSLYYMAIYEVALAEGCAEEVEAAYLGFGPAQVTEAERRIISAHIRAGKLAHDKVSELIQRHGQLLRHIVCAQYLR